MLMGGGSVDRGFRLVVPIAMMVPDLSFSASISSVKLPRYGAPKNEKFLVKRAPKFRAESGKYGTNGRATKMVPTTELRRTNGGGLVRSGTVNGSPNGTVNGSTKAPINGSAKSIINGSTKVVINGTPKMAVNGTSLVKGSKMSSLVKTQKHTRFNDDPFQEELKVLPSDEGFSWAKDNYNSVQRSIDIWSFVLSFRVRVLFDNAKWAYPGGFSEEKQVYFYDIDKQLSHVPSREKKSESVALLFQRSQKRKIFCVDQSPPVSNDCSICL